MNTTTMIINKKHKKDIDNACKQIKKLTKEQDKIFNDLARKLGYKAVGAENDVLFDHIYNGSTWMFDYSKD